KDNESLKYYVRGSDGAVFTNLSEKPTLAEVKKHDVYAAKNAKVNVTGGIGYLEDRTEGGAPTLFEDTDEKALVYFWVNDPAEQKADITLFRALTDENDEYIAARQMYDVMKGRPAGWILTIMIVSYLAGLALLVWFLHLAGHRNDDPVAADGSPEPVRYAKDGSRLVTAAIDKLPGDVHFVLFAILFGLCLGLPLAGMTEASGNISFWPWMPLGGALTTAVCFLLLAEWLASVCRTVKSGRGYWKHTLVGRLCSWLGRNGKYIAKHWKEAVANAKYAPKQLPKRAVFWVIGYLLVNTLLINLMVHMRGPVGTALLFLVLLVAFNLYVLARLIKYLRGLDEIIAASGTDADLTVDESGLPASLKTLVGNLTVTRETMDKAVAKAVQEERTRTELITNVTHDLKTPLTSLINYSDLLGRKAEKKELGDEESVQYIGVIHDQSEKLKHLIDDLLEASKVSTGNVQLNCTTLNLTELAAQAIAEFAPEMEKNGNEIIFTGPDGRPVTEEKLVFADGQKTYRVLANLLSNAQKYSAPNTRIYATLSDGAPGKDGTALTATFELKNTSAAPLNITAEELMERFVRGDRSRGETEGNGLGLSIARDLASLMGGSLALDIDGDLFKAIVTLPKQKASAEATVN
ncbi:MAG: HAMP domain-containing histidine kinase, partial [Clostridia bacterium]|nr:HAMP domain-containing histidine kinase [Clostridia bacterium]